MELDSGIGNSMVSCNGRLFAGLACWATGRRHSKAGEAGQDRAAVDVDEARGAGVAVLCDGAGSARLGGEGAEWICAHLPRWLLALVPSDASELPVEGIQQSVVQFIQKGLAALAVERSAQASDLAATLVACLLRKTPLGTEYLVLHVGDGVAAVFAQDDIVILSKPVRGEHANQTRFVTEEDAAEKMKVTHGTLSGDASALVMSDGAAESLYDPREAAVAPFCREMLAWFDQYEPGLVQRSVANVLQRDLTGRSGDDCSLAMLVPAPQGKLKAMPENPKQDQESSQPMTHPVKAPKKLIEVALPLDAINVASVLEKQPFTRRHPRSIHIWWARRPFVAARAVIFSQMVNDPSWKWELEHPGEIPPNHLKATWAKSRNRLFKIIEDMVLWENTTNEAVLEKAREEIRKSWRETCELNKDHPEAATLFNPDKLPGLHDPFAGGGAIPLEAQRLGLEAYASDLNPVAVLINKAMIEIPPKFAGKPPVNPEARKKFLGASASRLTYNGAQGLAEDVRYYGKWMGDEAEKRIGHLYPKVEVTAEMAKDRPDLQQYVGRKLTVIAWLWARTVKSPNPAYSHVDVPLASTFMLSTKAGKEAYVEPVIEGDKYRFTVKVGKPRNAEAAKNGTKVGRGGNFNCLISKAPIAVKYIRDQGVAGTMGARLMAVVAEGDGGRVYLSPTQEHEATAKSAKPAWRPEQEINHNPRDIRTQLYGLTKYGDLFTARQLVALTTFSDLVQEARERIKQDAAQVNLPDDNRPLSEGGTGPQAYADAVASYLGIASSRWADLSNSICSWNNGNQNIRALFARHAIPMNWDYAELSPFSKVAPWLSSVKSIVEASESLAPRVPAEAIQADAARLSLPIQKVVSTDPPYYDNIGYADLSDFFYVWLRRTLRSIYPGLFATITVPKAEELVATPYRHGTKSGAEDFFLNGMTRAMQRMASHSHPAFPLTIYYAFKQSETDSAASTSSTGWVTFLEAVRKAGLSVTGTWPMRTERAARSVGLGTNALASSVILVCHPIAADAPTIARREFLRELNQVLPEALDEMTRGAGDETSPVAPVDLSQAIIGPGMAVFSKYAAVLEADGTPMSVKTALQLINHFLAEDDFDGDTQFCLRWFEQHGWENGAFGEADVLARAKATSVDGLKAAGVVNSSGGKLRLLKWAEYPTDWDPEKDDRLPIWEVLHHLIRALKQQGESGAGRVLATGNVRGKAEAARQLAYRLYTLCERAGRAEDARAYNELVTSWNAIEVAAGAEPKRDTRTLFDKK